MCLAIASCQTDSVPKCMGMSTVTFEYLGPITTSAAIKVNNGDYGTYTVTPTSRQFTVKAKSGKAYLPEDLTLTLVGSNYVQKIDTECKGDTDRTQIEVGSEFKQACTSTTNTNGYRVVALNKVLSTSPKYEKYGTCVLGVPKGGDYVIIGGDIVAPEATLDGELFWVGGWKKNHDDHGRPKAVNGTDITWTSKVVNVPLCNEKKADLHMIKDPKGKHRGCEVNEIYGSYLVVIQPEVVDWTSDQEYYPIIFQTQDSYDLNVSLVVPEGYVPDVVAIADDVTNETSAVMFNVTEIGSTIGDATLGLSIQEKNCTTNPKTGKVVCTNKGTKKDLKTKIGGVERREAKDQCKIAYNACVLKCKNDKNCVKGCADTMNSCKQTAKGKGKLVLGAFLPSIGIGDVLPALAIAAVVSVALYMVFSRVMAPKGKPEAKKEQEEEAERKAKKKKEAE